MVSTNGYAIFTPSLESPFQVVLKNDLSFYDRTHMTKVMADESLSTIFLRHPVALSKKEIWPKKLKGHSVCILKN